MLISIIIPTLNEGERIKTTLTNINKSLVNHDAQVEVILVDNKKSTNTISKQFITKNNYDNILSISLYNIESNNRATQMNYGANKSENKNEGIFLFLHSDTLINSVAILELTKHYNKIMSNPVRKHNKIGCFYREFYHERKQEETFGIKIQTFIKNYFLKISCFLAKYRAKYFHWAFGDQAIFITKKHFWELNGFKKMNLFEDVDLCLRSKINTKQSIFFIINSKIKTSSRRYNNKGVILQILNDMYLSFIFLLTGDKYFLEKNKHNKY